MTDKKNMNEYLDIGKSIIISAPAGSGKTEKLARRYINLLQHGSEIEKILAITFTEKAAAEMKDRIFTILLREDKSLFERIKEKSALMRITTIHAFCRKLIQRFAMELSLDPSLEVLDEFKSSELWSEAVYDALRDEKDQPSVFFDYLKKKGLKGWGVLSRSLNTMHSRRPYSELLLEAGTDLDGSEEAQLTELYRRCFEKYRRKKTEIHAIDFNDMEILAYRAITTNPEWLNILYAFDEHTDHILIDEFQDTSSIQWKIIDKLTEEWRSGLGAKRSYGKTPTIFLVGDEKQSIYLFRGANVSVFHEVKDRLHDWLGKESVYIEAEENYRSLPKIIHFTNRLFGQVMQGSLAEPWRTKYAPFRATREGEGTVQLLVFENESSSKMTRLKEASLLCAKILSITGTLDIQSASPARKCRFEDIAILLRSRTHLESFESALLENKIPYIVVGGIGFYHEPEVAFLRELVSFMADPHDDFSLFVLLRSPIFSVNDSLLFSLLSGRQQSLYEQLKRSGSAGIAKTLAVLDKYLLAKISLPLAVLIENFLAENQAWKIFWEVQRHANIKKFLRVIEYYEAQGMSLIEIREALIRSKESSESKANVNAEGLDAVKIMTVHGAKGLQFPVVFLPSLDEAKASKNDSIFLDEIDHSIRFAYEEDYGRRSKNALHLLRKEKEHEEEKRLFYVAVTRAMDHLFISAAIRNDNGTIKPKGKLLFIEDAFPGTLSGAQSGNNFFDVITEKVFLAECKKSPRIFAHDSTNFFSGPAYTDPVALSKEAPQWVNVTEDIEIRTTHGQDWVFLGIVFHRLFDELSKGIIDSNSLKNRIEILLRNEFLTPDDRDRNRAILLEDFKKLRDSAFLDTIILPRSNSYSELPFVLAKKDKIYKGRIDRIIVENNTAFIYDYKTFPVEEKELDVLAQKYSFQMNIYNEACRDLLFLKTRSFILFTHNQVLIEL